jgi:ABC-type lipoprotein export system ATPase subunit
MITSMHIENFKCFKEFDIELGPFNVLIGPNGSGKSSLLDAVRLGGDLRPGNNRPANLHSGKFWSPLGTEFREYEIIRPDRIWTWMKRENLRVELRIYGREGRGPTQPYQHIRSEDGIVFRSFVAVGEKPIPETEHDQWYDETVGRVGYYRFAPESLKCPSLLTNKLTIDGHGLPGYLNHILSTDRPVFERVVREFCRRFPEYTDIMMPSVNVTPHPQRGESESPGRGKKETYRLFLKLRKQNDIDLEAEDVSDGQIVCLAFIALSCVSARPNILLVEEPENWVHHASLKEIVDTLKQLSKDKGVQVIMTTQSPYMLDGVDPGVVHVFQKDEEGAVHAKKLSDFEGAGEISDMFSTGEKWSLLSEKYGI